MKYEKISTLPVIFEVCDVMEMLKPNFEVSAKGHLQSNIGTDLTCFFPKFQLKITFFKRYYTYL